MTRSVVCKLRPPPAGGGAPAALDHEGEGDDDGDEQRAHHHAHQPLLPAQRVAGAGLRPGAANSRAVTNLTISM